MRGLLLPFTLLAATALGTSPVALAGSYAPSASSSFHGSGGSFHSAPSGGFTHSPGISHRSVPSEVPGMAFGGTPLRRSDSVPSWRDSGSVGGAHRSTGLPLEASQGWDPGTRHFWGHHYYFWSGNDWVIYDDSPGVDSYVQGPADSVEAEATPAPVAEAPSDPADDSLAAQVQRQLARLGYYAGPISGTLGPQTRDAIATFQQDQGLEATGRIGLQLLQALSIR